MHHNIIRVDAHAAPWLHLDAGVEAALLSVDVAILVALLVVASLLQLGSRPDGRRFSIEAAAAWGHSVSLLRLVEMLVYSSAAGSGVSLVGMTVVNYPLYLAGLALGLINIYSFAIICLLSIRWFWRRGATGASE
jgi:hypothetical protein